MKLIPSSTARRRTASADLRSFGGPQMPSPVRRIAPKPRRCTEISSLSKISPAAFAESSFLFIISLQNFPFDPVPRCLSVSPCLFENRGASSQATVGWRRCRRTGGSFYKARTGRLPRLLPFLPEARQLGKNSSVENCGLLEELAEESGANRNP